MSLQISLRRLSLIVWVLLTALLALGQESRVQGRPRCESPAPLEQEYRLGLTRPTTHLLDIEVVAGKVTEPTLDFVMPAWSPGRYAIYNFAKNVQEFRATGSQGQGLPWRKLDKQSWRIDSQDSGGVVRIFYRVYANDLDGTFSQFDTSHATVNGASVFMYMAGHRSDPLTLRVEAPAGWRVISGFAESTDQKTFLAPSYDRLVDTPLEISPEGSLDEFRDSGKTFRVAVHDYVQQDIERTELLEGVKKIVHSEMAMMPPPDFQHYTFIFHFAPEVRQGDGMEHLNSTQIVIRGSMSDRLREAFDTASHEFFHAWNVKRLRPAALIDLDFTGENYTRSLWFAEGVTSYYGYVHLLRSGLWDRQEFLSRLANEIRSLEAEPGRQLMSAESASFNAWFFDRPPQMQQTNFPNSTISYYNKGALLGMLLDLEIRSRSEGRKSLDDVMAFLFRKFYDDAPKGPSGPGRGYEERDLLEAVNTVSGSDFGTFFERYVQGTEPLTYAETLAQAGLKLRIETAPDSLPHLGVLTERNERGLRVLTVRPGGAADRAGLSRDDLLVATDDIPIEDEDLRDRLKFFAPGTKVPFTVERHGRQQKITVTLDPPSPDQYVIEELSTASQAQVAIRNSWLGK